MTRNDKILLAPLAAIALFLLAIVIGSFISSAKATPLVDSSCSGAGNCNTDNSVNNAATGGNATGGAGGSASTGPVTNVNVPIAKGGSVRSNIDVDTTDVNIVKTKSGVYNS